MSHTYRDILLLIGGILLAALLMLSLSSAMIRSLPHKVKAIVIFRMDDPQPYWQSDKLKRAIDLFLEEKVPVTLGIIPKVMNKSTILEHSPFISYTKDLVYLHGDLIEIAQHGLTHLALSKVRGASEFAGLPFHKQLEMIKEGKNILESIDPEIKLRSFIPPFDTFDNNTIEAVRELGFIVFSAMYDEDSSIEIGQPYVDKGLVIIHATSSLKNWDTGAIRSYNELRESFSRVYSKCGVFVLETHYFLFDEKNTEKIRKFIHYMKGKDVAFMKLGDFGEGYLNRTIRKEDGYWIIGKD